MFRIRSIALAAIAALVLAQPALAQTNARVVRNSAGTAVGAQPVQLVDPATGNWIVSPTVPYSAPSATLTTSTSTALPGAAATGTPTYLKVTVASVLTANLYLCLKAQTCSATVWDEMIPSGAAIGTRLFVELPFSTGVTYFTTATAAVNATRWGY